MAVDIALGKTPKSAEQTQQCDWYEQMNPRKAPPLRDMCLDEDRRKRCDQYQCDPGVTESAVELGPLLAGQASPESKWPDHDSCERCSKMDDDLRGEGGERLHAATVPFEGRQCERFAMEC